jgi:hypothetical protein
VLHCHVTCKICYNHNTIQWSKRTTITVLGGSWSSFSPNNATIQNSCFIPYSQDNVLVHLFYNSFYKGQFRFSNCHVLFLPYITMVKNNTMLCYSTVLSKQKHKWFLLVSFSLQFHLLHSH